MTEDNTKIAGVIDYSALMDLMILLSPETGVTHEKHSNGQICYRKREGVWDGKNIVDSDGRKMLGSFVSKDEAHRIVQEHGVMQVQEKYKSDQLKNKLICIPPLAHEISAYFSD